MRSQVDMRDWSFAKRALAEIKPTQPKDNHIFWVLVRMPDHSQAWYQLPKDLQFAMHQHEKTHANDWYQILVHSLINVPVSKYDEHGQAQIRVGQVLRVQRRHQRTKHSEQITRSQFVQPEFNRWGMKNISAVVTYLTHDFTPANQAQIKSDVKLINWHWRQHQWTKTLQRGVATSLFGLSLLLLSYFNYIHLLLISLTMGFLIILSLGWFWLTKLKND